MKFSFPYVLVAVIIGCTLAGVISQIFMGKGNAVEKISEEIIDHETGLNVDLDLN